MTRHFLLASDFDQTLSFHDSGHVLAELLGVDDFGRKVAGLAGTNLVQQGGELAYLIRHDPDFRGARREHLVEAGRRVHLKGALSALVKALDGGIADCRFSFFVVSAAPREVVVSALEGIVPPEHVYASAIARVVAGYGKVAVIDELSRQLGVPSDRVIYMGDGSSDVHVMLHVNNGEGFTIAVSENRQLARIARCTVLSDNACSVLIPVFDQVLGIRTPEIRRFLESHGLTLDGWERARTDRVMIRETSPEVATVGGSC